jgi:hypothetical protein
MAARMPPWPAESPRHAALCIFIRKCVQEERVFWSYHVRLRVIVKDLPVTQCCACQEYLLEHTVMQRVERILQATDQATELEIVRYAA